MSFEPVPKFNDNDVADVERLNTIVENLNELNNNRLTMKYDTPELSATRNLKIVAGRVDLPPGSASETVTVTFNEFFQNASCVPVVNATLSTTKRKKSFITISDVNSKQFTVTVESATGEPFVGNISVHWTAYGF